MPKKGGHFDLLFQIRVLYCISPSSSSQGPTRENLNYWSSRTPRTTHNSAINKQLHGFPCTRTEPPEPLLVAGVCGVASRFESHNILLPAGILCHGNVETWEKTSVMSQWVLFLSRLVLAF